MSEDRELSPARAEVEFARILEGHKPRADLSTRVSIGVGRGDRGAYVGITFLPGTVNGISLETHSEVMELADLLLFAAESLRREREGL